IMRSIRDRSSDVCASDLHQLGDLLTADPHEPGEREMVLQAVRGSDRTEQPGGDHRAGEHPPATGLAPFEPGLCIGTRLYRCSNARSWFERAGRCGQAQRDVLAEQGTHLVPGELTPATFGRWIRSEE